MYVLVYALLFSSYYQFTFYLCYSISPRKFSCAPLVVVYIYKAINVIVVWDGSTQRSLCRADFSLEVTQCCEKPENIAT